MRDIIPPKSFKPKMSDVQKIERKEAKQAESFKVDQTRAPRRRWSKSLLVFLLFVVLLGGGAASYYFFYMKSNEKPQQVSTEPVKETKDEKTKEIDNMLASIEESVNSVDQDETDLDSPTLDLNISF